jgi:hypothetical protein
MSRQSDTTSVKSQPQFSKVKKFEWYSDFLMSQALSEEKSGSIQEAIRDYLKAADVLLLLAKDQEDYTLWKRYSDKAALCQQKVKQLVASA